jgi:hypothetical protein
MNYKIKQWPTSNRWQKIWIWYSWRNNRSKTRWTDERLTDLLSQNPKYQNLGELSIDKRNQLIRQTKRPPFVILWISSIVFRQKYS